MKINCEMRDQLHRWVDSLGDNADVVVPSVVTREVYTTNGIPFERFKMEVRVTAEVMRMLDPNKPESYLL